MAGPSVAEIRAALDVYEASIASVGEKRADRNSKLSAMQAADSEFEVAQTAYMAAIDASIAAEAELQRLIDEHTPDGAETPPGP